MHLYISMRYVILIPTGHSVVMALSYGLEEFTLMLYDLLICQLRELIPASRLMEATHEE
jgi:hypothetical protein